MISRLFVLCALCACFAGDVGAQKVLTFGHGAAQVTLPDNFVAIEQNDGTLRAVFGRAADHRLELTYNDATTKGGAKNIGEEFVRAQATRKNLKLFEQPGKVVFLEPAPDTQIGGKAYRTAHWQIGFGTSVVVMTLTAPKEVTPELDLFLGKSLNNVVNSVRRRG